MRKRLTACTMLLAAAGCSPDAPQPSANQIGAAAGGANAGTPTLDPAATGSDMRRWLVGNWSFEESCATDFAVHYNQDGSLQNYTDSGTWTIDGDRVTETITQKFEMGDADATKVDPPETRSYVVKRVDNGHGEIVIDGRTVKMLRC